MKLVEKHKIPTPKIIIQKALREEVPALLSLSKLSIFFIKPVFSKKASSPTKLGEVLSMGIPVICNSGIGDVDAVIQESDCGITIDNFDDKTYDKAIESIDNFVIIDKNKIISTAEKHFSLKKGVELYERVYLQVMLY